MGARQKLNQAYLNGALIIATIAGLATRSWAVFWIIGISVAVCGFYAGNIRPGSRGG